MSGAIAIVGMGARLPGAPDLARFRTVVQSGEAQAREVPARRWDHAAFYDQNPRRPDRTYARLLASVDDIEEFSPEHFGILPRRARFMDPQQRLVLDVARMAIEDAGRAPLALPRQTGVYVGISVSEHYQLTTARLLAAQLRGGRLGRVPDGIEPAWEFLTESVPPLQAHSMVGQMLNMAAANVAQAFDLHGPALATDSACSSALVALADAVLHLRAGVVDAALVAGVYVACTPNNMIAFSRIGAISPSDACRPFDERADGFVLGEGAGCVLLRRLEDAVQGGDRIWAVVRGIGINNDGRAEGPMTPRAEGQIAALERAYADAGMSPAQVGLVETHGTATRVGDRIESTSLAQVFGAARRGLGALPPCQLTSVKGNVGHTLAAAGAAGLLNAALALADRRIPPLAGYEQARADLPLGDAGLEVASQPREWTSSGGEPRAAGVSSFGFGGTNVHIVLEEAPPASAPRRAARRADEGPDRAELFVLSAPTPAHLARSADVLAGWLAASDAPLADVAYTLATRRLEPARAAIVARTRAELVDRLGAAARAASGGEAPDGVAVHLGGEPAGPIAFLFPGQGAQAPDLCRDLWDLVPLYRERLAELVSAGEAVAGRSLVELLYPENGARDAAAAALTRTEVCQPALAAVELALVELLRAVGVEPSVLLGHSLGEFVAAAAGGALPARDAVQLVAERGRLMAELSGDHGAMAALAVDRAGAAELLRDAAGAVMANFNHPRQVVVSGATASVEDVIARAGAAGVRATRLPVSHGFHSPVLGPMADRFAPVLERTALTAPRALVVSCASSHDGSVAPGPLEAEPAAIRARLAHHALAAVDFEAGVREAWRAGARVFVQVGGGATLLSMVTATLAHDGCAVRLSVPVAPSGSEGTAGLLTALAQLIGGGVPVSAAPLFRGRSVRLTALPSSLLATRPFWIVRPPTHLPALPVLGEARGGDAARRAEVKIGPMGQRGRDDLAGPALDPADPARGAIVDLFRRQLEIIQGQIDVLRARGIEAHDIQGQARPSLAPIAARAPRADVDGAAAAVAGDPEPDGEPAAEASRAEEPTGPADRAAIEQQVLAIVARVSALPVGALSPSARLVDDLGLDSIMMVELGASLQEGFGLGELPDGLIGRDATLADLVDRIAARGAGPGRSPSPANRPARSSSPGNGHAAARGNGVARAPDVEAAPGPAVERHRAAWVARPIAPAQANELPAGGALIVAGDEMRAVADALAARLRAAGRAVQVSGEATWPAGAGLFIDLVGLGGRGDDALDAAALRAPIERACAVLAAASRAGVRPHYLAAAVATSAAPLAGFARALAVEWPDRLARSVELPGDADPATVAGWIAAELASSDRTPEVSLATGERRVVEIEPAPLVAGGEPGRGLVGRTALVTGGSHGLGARLAVALARAGVARIALIGRRSADSSIERVAGEIGAAGAEVRYLACDVRDPAALAAAVGEARAAFGPIELVAHAAGVNADGPVEAIAPGDLARVFDTKVAGALGLWRACAGDPLLGFLLYGSWAGRFGNRHQTVYAAANRALSGLVTRLAGERPEVRVVSVDLPPWEGSGMIERLPAVVRQAMRARGVPFLTDEVGLAHLLGELTGPPGAAEVVIGAGPRGAGRRDRARIHLDPSAPWLADHAPGGEARLPLAAALDMAAAAAGRRGLAPPRVIRDFQILHPIAVPAGGCAIAVEARAAASPGAVIDVEIWLESGGEPRLAASGTVEAGAAVDAVATARGGLPVQLDLDRFYAEHTFHGPRMRGIARVDEVGASHARGAVVTAEPGWPRVALDILGLDGALQLAGFFARERLGRSALPVGVAECRVLAALPPASQLACAVELERIDESELGGRVDLVGDAGPLVQLRGLRARVVDAAAIRRAPVASGNGRTGNGHNGNGAAHKGNGAGNGHAIDPASYRVEQFPELVELEQRMKMVEAFGLRIPYFHQHEGLTNQRSIIGGNEFVNYSSYNYVGLSGHPEVNRAVEAAVARYGTSVSASRVASGEKPIHRELERAIADFLGCEDAIVMVGGHATNVSVIGHLLDSRDLILHDSLAHDSILGGARLSGARRRPFPHNDVDALARLLEQVRPHARRVLIAVEGVYSMDGDVAPLDRIIELKKRYGALLLVDEAHSLGVIGATGRGIGERFAVRRADVDLWMGTLSKSLASCGGYIAGSAALVKLLKYTNPGFVYSVGISPANAAAALAALHILAREPDRVATLQARARLFLDLMRERGIDTGLSHGSAVVPCIVPSSVDCLRLAQALHERRINVQPILYPAVEENLARLRFFVTSGHSEADLAATADAVREELAAIDPRHLRREAGPPARRAESREASP